MLGCGYRKRRNCPSCGLSLSATRVQDLQRAANETTLALLDVRWRGRKLRFCSGNVRSLCGLSRFIQDSCCSVQNIDHIAQSVLQRSLNCEAASFTARRLNSARLPTKRSQAQKSVSNGSLSRKLRSLDDTGCCAIVLS